MTPKFLLRYPDAKSSFDDMITGSSFKRIIPDQGPAVENPEKVKKVIFCSGKLYYELAKERELKELEDRVAIHRIEQVKDNL